MVEAGRLGDVTVARMRRVPAGSTHSPGRERERRRLLGGSSGGVGSSSISTRVSPTVASPRSTSRNPAGAVNRKRPAVSFTRPLDGPGLASRMATRLPARASATPRFAAISARRSASVGLVTARLYVPLPRVTCHSRCDINTSTVLRNDRYASTSSAGNVSIVIAARGLNVKLLASHTRPISGSPSVLATSSDRETRGLTAARANASARPINNPKAAPRATFRIVCGRTLAAPVGVSTIRVAELCNVPIALRFSCAALRLAYAAEAWSPFAPNR